MSDDNGPGKCFKSVFATISSASIRACMVATVVVIEAGKDQQDARGTSVMAVLAGEHNSWHLKKTSGSYISSKGNTDHTWTPQMECQKTIGTVVTTKKLWFS